MFIIKHLVQSLLCFFLFKGGISKPKDIQTSGSTGIYRIYRKCASLLTTALWRKVNENIRLITNNELD